MLVAVMGECMIELAPKGDADFHWQFAGDTLNTSIYMARSVGKAPIEIAYVTGVGDDHFSHRCVSYCTQEGINTDWMRRFLNHQLGLYLIQNTEDGERHFYYYRAHSAARRLFEGEVGDQLCQRLLKSCDTIYLSGISLAILYESGRKKLMDCLRQAKESGITICFDSNFRLELWKDHQEARQIIEQAWQLVSIALPSFEDERYLFDDRDPKCVIKRLYDYGVSEVVLKNGSKGYYLSYSEKTDDIQHVPVVKSTETVDTTGAGDAFNGVYLACRLLGLSPEWSAEQAANQAAQVVAYHGAIIPKA